MKHPRSQNLVVDLHLLGSQSGWVHMIPGPCTVAHWSILILKPCVFYGWTTVLNHRQSVGLSKWAHDIPWPESKFKRVINHWPFPQKNVSILTWQDSDALSLAAAPGLFWCDADCKVWVIINHHMACQCVYMHEYKTVNRGYLWFYGDFFGDFSWWWMGRPCWLNGKTNLHICRSGIPFGGHGKNTRPGPIETQQFHEWHGSKVFSNDWLGFGWNSFRKWMDSGLWSQGPYSCNWALLHQILPNMMNWTTPCWLLKILTTGNASTFCTLHAFNLWSCDNFRKEAVSRVDIKL